MYLNLIDIIFGRILINVSYRYFSTKAQFIKFVLALFRYLSR